MNSRYLFINYSSGEFIQHGLPCRINDRDEVFGSLSVSNNLGYSKMYKMVTWDLVQYLKMNSIKQLPWQHNL